MSYRKSKAVVNILLSALFFAVYCYYIHNSYWMGSASLYDVKFLSGAMLLFIGLGIAAMIVVQIVFLILKSVRHAADKDEPAADETTNKTAKLIGQRSGRAGFYIVGLAFVISLILLALGSRPAIVLNILFLSFWVGAMAKGELCLYDCKAQS